MERKLVAIVSADIAGYSQLMGADGEGTLAALKAHRNSFDPMIYSHGGRIVKTTGHGLLVEQPQQAFFDLFQVLDFLVPHSSLRHVANVVQPLR